MTPQMLSRVKQEADALITRVIVESRADPIAILAAASDFRHRVACPPVGQLELTPTDIAFGHAVWSRAAEVSKVVGEALQSVRDARISADVDQATRAAIDAANRAVGAG